MLKFLGFSKLLQLTDHFTKAKEYEEMVNLHHYLLLKKTISKPLHDPPPGHWLFGHNSTSKLLL